MKKFLKIFLLTILISFTLVSAAAGIFLLMPTSLKLNEELLINSSDFANFYDTHNSVIETNVNKNGSDNALDNENLTKAFIASEDKNFYTHHGLDYPRIVKSFFVNLFNGDYSQGASTISQQLIKNTHLTQEKTITRKLKEIKLAQKLEDNYSKNEILLMYLNTIYFGENVYGVENAAKFYYSKRASDLDLNECATLAGIIPSPARYNPISDINVARDRRNLVLKRMLDNGFIDKNTYEQTINKEIKLNVSKSDDIADSYIKACLNEIFQLTDLSPYDIQNANVYTYYEKSAQTACKNAVIDNGYDFQSILIDNQSHGVSGYYSTCGEIRRSPASAIKPLLVYAPSIERGTVYSMTRIKDEPISIDGYSPQNYKNEYYGDISVEFALSHSLNIPSVKLYNSTGIGVCKSYLDKLDISDDNDSLNMALGNFNEGITLKSLAGAYTVFPNYGKYEPCAFVKKITDKSGKTLYERKTEGKTVFSQGTATIINQMLNECAENGTAKKLSGKPYTVCAKTGTLGTKDGNTDAYTVAYTAKNTLACWYGNADSSFMPNSVTGGSAPAYSANYILDYLYSKSKPEKLSERGIKKLYIDKKAYEDRGEFLIAADGAKEKDSLYFTFTDNHYPKTVAEKTGKPIIKGVTLSVVGDTVVIPIITENDVMVEIRKVSDNKTTVVYDGFSTVFTDELNGDTIYEITPYKVEFNEKIYGDTIEKKVKKTRKKSDFKPDNWWND